MSIYDFILQRRTIRRFKQNPVSYELLEKIVNAGRLAPSGSNLQPLEFIIVDEPEKVAQVYAHTKWAGYLPPDQGPPPEGKRPTAFVVIIINRSRREKGGAHDVGAAIMNMILTGLEESIGSCWIASIDRNKLRTLLSVPERCDIDSVVAFGYLDESPISEDRDDTVKYYRDEQNVLHVPKRPIECVLHHNKY